MTRPVKLIGIGASPGAAVGRAFLIDRKQVQEPRRHVSGAEIEAEIGRLQQAIQATLKNPAVQEKLHKLGLTAVGSTSAEFTAFIKSETARWRDVVQANHISLE